VHKDNQVVITPIDKEAPTFVNGEQIVDSMTLNHVRRVNCNHTGYEPASLMSGQILLAMCI